MSKYLLSFFFAALAALSFAQQPIPAPTDFLVNDYAGMLSRQEVVQLGDKLREYALQTSTQIVIFTEQSLQGEDDFERARLIYENWKIGGSRENSNGVLLYVAQQDRKVRIITGYGAEGFLPDALAKRIIDEIITPNFRQNQYYRGLDRATSAIMELGQGEYSNEGPQQPRDAKGGIPAMLVIVVIILLLIIFSKRGRGGDDDDDDGGYYRGGRYDTKPHRRRHGGGWIFFPGGGWGGGGSSGGSGGGGWGGSGGGGFGGFGGGLTGGGGAGGSW